MKNKVLYFILIVIVVIALWAGCNKIRGNKTGQIEQIQPSVPITAIQVQKKEILDLYSTTGSLEAFESADIGSEIAGRIQQINVKEGDRVARGQLLAELDAATYQAQLAQAEAKLASAKADWYKIESGARPQELATAEQAVREAQANYSLASTDFIRIKNMFEQGVATRQELDNAENTLKIRFTALEKAGENLSLVREGARQEERAAAKAKLAEEEANVQYAKSQLAKTLLRAPFDGIVTRKYKDTGEMVSAGMDRLFRIERIQSIKSIHKIPQEDIGKFQTGQSAQLTAPDGKYYEGTIRLISPAVEPDSRAIKLEIWLDNPDYHLRPGMFVRGSILVGKNSDALVIPREALLPTIEPGKFNIALIRDNQSNIVPIRQGITQGNEVEILEGVSEGDMVALRGADRLTDGTSVRIVDSESGNPIEE